MSSDFRVTVTDPTRRELWRQWIGTDTVCVRSPIAIDVHIEGKGDTRAYVLDEQALTPAQRLALAEGLAELFGAEAWEVDADMRSHGIAILAEHCSVMVRNPARWLL
jgi:hypothetical protein